MLFDTHFHLDLVNDPKGVALLSENKKIYTIAVTNLPRLFENTEKLCSGLKFIRPALGYHPELAAKHYDQLELFSELLDRTRYIGEIGLDNQKKTEDDYRRQKKIFEKIISLCADSKNKILTVHSRKAEKDVVEMIGNKFPGKVILHWYSGSIKDLETALSFGFYFSVNLNMTQSLNGRKIIGFLPKDRILLETDGPFTIFQDEPCIPETTSIILSEILKIKNANSNSISADDINGNFKELLKE